MPARITVKTRTVVPLLTRHTYLPIQQRLGNIGVLLCTLLLTSATVQAAAPHYATSELLDLSLEDLSDLTISSVSKRPEKLSKVAASAYVITSEAIRRSGATSLPEVLRLAPNLLVARVGNNKYAISARGFNSTTANKLQVLIDGRIAYTPLYSGVFWDVQDVLLQDIERIEVISGPGATTWGSNAVNGVISIITRPAADTQGGLVVAGVGNIEQGAALRYGGTLASGGHYRVYGKAENDNQSTRESGGGADDDAQRGQLGFRADPYGDGHLSVQGNVYEGRQEQPSKHDIETRGLNFLTRWQHNLMDGSQVQLQAYYDRTERDQPGVFSETLDILDIELQRGLTLGTHQKIVWGVGHRSAWDDVNNSSALAFLPAEKHLSWNHIFLQDEVSLQPDLKLTLGGRLEHNSYTGLEFMPNARLAWHATDQDLLWISLAHTVRTPSRLDRDFFVPAPPLTPQLAGGPEFESETADTFEIGYRGQRFSRLNYSLTAFYSDYDKLRTLEPTGTGSFELSNGLQAQTYGLEAWGDYQVSERWRLSAGALRLNEDFKLKPGSADVNGGKAEAHDPSHQWMLRSHFNPDSAHELDLTLRHVGKLSSTNVPAYTALDIRYGWKPADNVELSVTAWNLLDPAHSEFGSASNRIETERSVYLELQLRY